VGGLAILCALVSASVTVAAARAPGQRVEIVALGDSLTAGLGLPGAAAFPARLAGALQAQGESVRIANAGVSGDTAADGLDRLDWSVPEGTEAVILELGANDALRGLDPKLTRQALEAIIRRLAERHIEVLLCGMRAPRNLGSDYVRAFDAIFPELAATYNLVFYPFFLDGIAMDQRFNQGDGLHPTAAGVDVIVKGILPKADELIARVRTRS
jgi:acyl-CoA thioesterase-1